jgi:hypothetical protein
VQKGMVIVGKKVPWNVITILAFDMPGFSESWMG